MISASRETNFRLLKVDAQYPCREKNLLLGKQNLNSTHEGRFLNDQRPNSSNTYYKRLAGPGYGAYKRPKFTAYLRNHWTLSPQPHPDSTLQNCRFFSINEACYTSWRPRRDFVTTGDRVGRAQTTHSLLLVSSKACAWSNWKSILRVLQGFSDDSGRCWVEQPV